MTQRTNRKRFTEEQIKIEKIINDLGLETILEYPVDRFFIDCFVKDCNVGVEWDGPMHKLSKKKDKDRDSIILNAGIRSIIRISSFSPESIENFKKELLSYC